MNIRQLSNVSVFLTLVMLLAGFAAPMFAQTTVAGVTPGKLSVSATGQATYSLPIKVPPGISGIQPKLSLNYSGGRGNDIAGMGWSIGGLSTIHRCSKTPAQDGQWGGVNYTSEDRFCIDGKRLVAISGVYGADGTEYRTEIDDFSKIVSYGVQGSGPAWFRVWTKSGRIIDYGNTGDSRVEAVFTAAAGPDVRVWALNRMADSVGNYMSYSYVEDSITGAHRIERIDYTHNDSAAVTAQSYVQFVYEARADVSSGYVGGALSTKDVRLTAIHSNTDGALVRDYRLAYETGAATGRSRLLNVTECDGIGGTENCLAPTTFNWKAEKAGFTNDVGYLLPQTSTRVSGGGYNGEVGSLDEGAVVDFNGDGLKDYVQAYVNRDKLIREAWRNTGSGWAESAEYLPPFEITYRKNRKKWYELGRFIDVNGDGLMDFVQAATIDSINYKGIWINTGSGWQLSSAYQPPFLITALKCTDSSSCQLFRYGEFVDVNGDGLLDFVQAYQAGKINRRDPESANNRTTWLNTGTGWQESTTFQTPFNIFVYDMVTPAKTGGRRSGRFMDANGDGLLDFVRAETTDNNSTIVTFRTTWLNTGSGWQESLAHQPPFDTASYSRNSCVDCVTTFKRTYFGDFVDANGDGLLDFVQAYQEQGPTKRGESESISNRTTWLNTGKGWETSAKHISPFDIFVYDKITTDRVGGRKEGEFVDVNGDGLKDFVRAVEVTETLGAGPGTKYQTTWLSNGNGWQEDVAYKAPFTIAHYWKTRSCLADGTCRIKYHSENHGKFFDLDGKGLQDFAADMTYTTNDGYTFSTKATWLINSSSPDQLLSATNNLGATTTLSYARLNDPAANVYKKANDAVFPVKDIQPSRSVVSEVLRDNGVGGQYHTAYHYAGAKIDFSGRTRGDTRFSDFGVASRYESGGSGDDSETSELYTSKSSGMDFHGSAGAGYLGFQVITTTDLQTGIATSKDYLQSFPYIGLSDSSRDFIPDASGLTSGTSITSKSKTYASRPLNQGANQLRYVSQSVEERFEAVHGHGNTPISSTTTSGVYDDFGNATQTTNTSSADGETFTTVTNNTYTNDTVNWYLGQLIRNTVTNTLPGGVSATRVRSFTHDLATGLLSQKVIEPDNTTLRLTTDYSRDVFGHVVKENISGPDIVTRSTTSEYSAAAPNYGRFITRRSNALGHTETSTYDNRFGTPKSLTSPNGITTNWVTDGFGRQTAELRANGTQTRVSYDLCVTQCPSGGVYAVATQNFITASGLPYDARGVSYSDVLDRDFRSESQGFDGTAIYADKVFNALGQLEKTSRPYFAGTLAADVQWVSKTYDVISRAKTVTAPDGGVESIIYDGLSTTITNALNQIKHTVVNALGHTIDISDAAGTRILNAYTPFGNLGRAEVLGMDGSSAVTSMSYDIRGRKKSMNDPGMGSWTYAYNALDELVTQTDDKLQTVNMSYDTLGRMTSRTEAEGTTTWAYDNAFKTAGIGKLDKITRSQDDYVLDAVYDSLGRQQTSSTTYQAKTYSMSSSYDAAGRAHSMTYPAASDGSRLAVEYAYNTAGYLEQVRESGGSTVYWQALDKNAEGNVTEEKLGNGLSTIRDFNSATNRVNDIVTYNGLTQLQNLGFEFDVLGNLTSRSDFSQSRKESFGYDNLNRLLDTTVVDTASSTQLDQTALKYDALGNITFKSDVGDYAYNGIDGGVHAVTQAGNTSYRYSGNGEMIASADAVTGVEQRSILWSSFNKPVRIGDLATGSASNFVYGPDRTRIRQTSYSGGSLSKTTTYIGNAFEHHAVSGSGDELIHYIRADNTVAMVTKLDNGVATSDSTQYVHRDHLGSVSLITDEAGGVVEARSFDAWGKPRNADWTPAAGVTLTESKRGYTGHEHLDNVGLIHMNGRVQDPGLGRFISADPTTQFVNVAQNYNRYSYVLNNPLSFTDPSGFHVDSDDDSGNSGGNDDSDNSGGNDDDSDSGYDDRDSESDEDYENESEPPGPVTTLKDGEWGETLWGVGLKHKQTVNAHGHLQETETTVGVVRSTYKFDEETGEVKQEDISIGIDGFEVTMTTKDTHPPGYRDITISSPFTDSTHFDVPPPDLERDFKTGEIGEAYRDLMERSMEENIDGGPTTGSGGW